MNLEQVAAHFDNRKGYRLVAYGPVGLPVFRLTTTGLCLNKKDLDPIEEFVLRGVAAGIESVGHIAGLLGLEKSVIESSLAELIRTECVCVAPASSTTRQKIELTQKGRDTASAQERVIPVEQTVVFWVDGLTRKPRFYPQESLYKLSELQSAGIPEVRAFPARPPELQEIDIKDVIEVVRFDAGRSEPPRQLLQIGSIERRDRVFLDAVALAYKAEAGGEIQVDFAIDGRLSREHGQAFARANGVEKTKLFRGLLERVCAPSMAEVIGDELSRQVEESSEGEDDSQNLQQAARRARARISEARIEAAEAGPQDAAHRAEQPDSSAKAYLKALEEKISTMQVRPLAVYEHAALLREALETAQERLLIISPWIRRAVVNGEFMRTLQKTLGRGVTVYIGYGLGDADEGEKNWDKEARKELERLADSSARFCLKRTGDTHAKVLIKDHEFFVISSFNWLSFKGDPHRTFREEWGTLVSIPEVVDKYFNEMVARFS